MREDQMWHEAKAVASQLKNTMARRLEETRTVKGHSYSEAAAVMGMCKNKAWRMENPYAKTRSHRYGTPCDVNDYAAALHYCGMSWGDLEAKEPASMSELMSQVDRLPGLDEGQRHVMRTTLMSLYVSLRQAEDDNAESDS